MPRLRLVPLFQELFPAGLGLPELTHVQTSRGQSPNSMPLGSSPANPGQPLSPLSVRPWARQRGDERGDESRGWGMRERWGRQAFRGGKRGACPAQTGGPAAGASPSGPACALLLSSCTALRGNCRQSPRQACRLIRFLPVCHLHCQSLCRKLLLQGQHPQ